MSTSAAQKMAPSTQSYNTLQDANFAGKRTLLRLDLNVPMENGHVSDTTRLERVLPTLKALIAQNAKIVILSHFGRPKGIDTNLSLQPIAKALSKLLGTNVAFAPDCIGDVAQQAIEKLQNGDVLMLENTRFYAQEEANETQFVSQLATLGDIYINDAFSCAHRAHASTEGLAHLLPSYVGLSMQAELEALAKALLNPQRPLAAIVGGAKISTKLDLLANLMEKVDILMIGGGMANTFLAAQGVDVGKSLCEHDLVSVAKETLKKAKLTGCEIVLPVDAMVAMKFEQNAPHQVVDIHDVPSDHMILDIGPKSVEVIAQKLKNCRTLVWNGPFGAFEIKPFNYGTNAVGQAAAQLVKNGSLIAIAGGGDTVSAINQAGVADDMTYLSTAGGAFLEWLEGKTLPGVAALQRKA